MEAADFSGYVTKAGLKCTDGRTIMPEAFKHQDKMTVPLVWQHGHNNADNVLGHAVLENRPDGVYGYAFCNTTPQGKNAKALVEHGDITFFSIYANQLVERSKQVFHGVIREVSLVLAGANPGAKIDYVSVQHSDGDVEQMEDEAVIYTGLELQHSDKSEAAVAEDTDEASESVVHDDGDTVKDIYDSLSEEQKNVVHYMIGAALKASGDTVAQSAVDKKEGDLEHQEGNDDMSRNVFEQNDNKGDIKHNALSSDDVKGIVAHAQELGSLKKAVEAYALQHGINDIESLFPEAKTLGGAPEWDKRRTEWVAGVLNGTRKSPFSRVKTRTANITMDEARAKGYIKGNFKKEEFFSLQARTTGPTTVYKKQKLDRDDIIDITDFDVVTWLKGEMRLMIEEELARAILIGDGREGSDEDKIKDPVGATDGLGIRSIANDHELYATTVNVNIDDANSNYGEVVDALMRARRLYKGSGNPTFYTTEEVRVEMLLVKDNFGQRMYKTDQELAAALGVSSIVAVEVMEGQGDLLGIVVNLNDYVVGADAGGQLTMFDDFDIDYNQYKYLIETRVSGALVKLKSALVVRKTAAANVLVEPQTPAFVKATGVITIPAQTGVVYRNKATNAVLTAGAQSALAAGASFTVLATPATNYYFANNAEDEFTFKRNA